MATLDFTPAELDALAFVMSARYDNMLDTRQQTGDSEYDDTEMDAASVLVFALNDFGGDLSVVSTVEPLRDAIFVALDTPEAFEDLDMEALRSAKAKLDAWVEG